MNFISRYRLTRSDHALHLTPREREVLGRIVEGLSSKEIAWTMGLSTGTVCGYRKTLYRKLGVTCRSAAISVGRGMLGQPQMPGLRSGVTPPDQGVKQPR